MGFFVFMADERLKRDVNRKTVIAGVTDDALLEIVMLRIDPTTLRLKVAGVITSMTVASFDHGRNSDIDTTPEQITTLSVTATMGVLIKAANGNSGTIYVGNSDVTANTADATDGFELGAGESLLVKVDNVNKVYVIASVVNQSAYWFVV